jgi:hypothetical protein
MLALTPFVVMPLEPLVRHRRPGRPSRLEIPGIGIEGEAAERHRAAGHHPDLPAGAQAARADAARAARRQLDIAGGRGQAAPQHGEAAAAGRRRQPPWGGQRGVRQRDPAPGCEAERRRPAADGIAQRHAAGVGAERERAAQAAQHRPGTAARVGDEQVAGPAQADIPAARHAAAGLGQSPG